LVDNGVLEEDYSSEWEFPKKNGTIRVVTDFRNLNLLLRHNLSPIFYSKDRGHDLFNGRVYLCFSIGLKYGLSSRQTRCDAQKLCTIVFPWYMGKYKYKHLPMGIKIAWFLMVFKTSCLSLSKIWNMLRQSSYLDDLLIPTNSSFKDHLLMLEMVLARLSTTGMGVNISKSKFFVEQIEYLGYWITRQGIQPIRNKVEAILNIKAPKTRK
jgi:hypothetical protein